VVLVALGAMSWLGARQRVRDVMSRQSALGTEGTALVLNCTEPGKALGGTAPGLITGLQGASRNLDQGRREP
jgi:hypothetical protein